jgi:DNA-binding transcriptional ArsR family regulator
VGSLTLGSSNGPMGQGPLLVRGERLRLMHSPVGSWHSANERSVRPILELTDKTAETPCWPGGVEFPSPVVPFVSHRRRHPAKRSGWSERENRLRSDVGIKPLSQSFEQKSRIAKFTLDIDQTIYNHMVVNNLDTTFVALSDSTRRAMLERLSHGPATVHGLTEPFALSQQMISKHIAYLVRARIVIKTKRGRESVCTLRPEAIKTVSDWAISYRRFWEESFDKLDVVVNQMKKEEVRDDRKHG